MVSYSNTSNVENGRKALLIFHDDSSLFVARQFADLITQNGWEPEFLLYRDPLKAPPDISDRQIALGLGRYRLSHQRSGIDAADHKFLSKFEMVASAKYPVLFRRIWRWNCWRFADRRPCFVGLFPGLELKRPHGWNIRKHADVLCCVTRDDIASYQNDDIQGKPANQVVLRFHPSLMRAPNIKKYNHIQQATFFTQSAIPSTLEGRRAVTKTLVTSACANPNVRFCIKLRHNKNENKRHTHPEEWPYEELFHELDDVPENIFFDDRSTPSVLEETDLAITCCSTAGIEAVARHIPALFILDFPFADHEPLISQMTRLLDKSGLRVDTQSVISLNWRAPTLEWLDNVTSSRNDFLDLLFYIDHFSATVSRSYLDRVRQWVIKSYIALELRCARAVTRWR